MSPFRKCSRTQEELCWLPKDTAIPSLNGFRRHELHRIPMRNTPRQGKVWDKAKRVPKRKQPNKRNTTRKTQNPENNGQRIPLNTLTFALGELTFNPPLPSPYVALPQSYGTVPFVSHSSGLILPQIVHQCSAATVG